MPYLTVFLLSVESALSPAAPTALFLRANVYVSYAIPIVCALALTVYAVSRRLPRAWLLLLSLWIITGLDGGYVSVSTSRQDDSGFVTIVDAHSERRVPANMNSENPVGTSATAELSRWYGSYGTVVLLWAFLQRRQRRADRSHSKPRASMTKA